MKHLLIALVSVERDDWDSIVYVESEGVSRVVDQNYFRQLELFLFEYP